MQLTSVQCYSPQYRFHSYADYIIIVGVSTYSTYEGGTTKTEATSTATYPKSMSMIHVLTNFYVAKVSTRSTCNSGNEDYLDDDEGYLIVIKLLSEYELIVLACRYLCALSINLNQILMKLDGLSVMFALIGITNIAVVSMNKQNHVVSNVESICNSVDDSIMVIHINVSTFK